MTSRGPVPLRRYGGGGVASSPQIAEFGEGSSPEAYVPLPDGRSIPVKMKDGGAGAGPGGQSVNYQGGDIHFHGGVDTATLPQVQAIVAEAGRRQLSELQRNIGATNAKWQQRYG